MPRAHVFLPTATVFEAAPTHYLNQEGRLQQASPLHAGGAPIMQVSGGGHPPREFLSYIPGGEPRPAAEILSGLAEALAGSAEAAVNGDIWNWLAKDSEVFSRLAALTPAERAAGLRLLPYKSGVAPFTEKSMTGPAKISTARLELVLVEQTFGTEELAGYSPFIQKMEEEPHLILHQKTAAELDLASGDRVAVQLPGGEVSVVLKTASNMSKEVAILPRHRRLAWQKIRDWPAWLAKEDLRKR